MSTTEVSVLVGALVGLMGALQAWLVNKALVHSDQLNGVMSGRIRAGANDAIAADKAASFPSGVVPVVISKAEKIAELQGQIDALRNGGNGS